MAKLTLTDLANLQNENTAVSTINANSTLIETAMENTLSRDGTTPNTMSANLDMNNMQILNLPAPAGASSPARLQDVVSEATIASVPPVGTSGAVVGLLNANNTHSGNNTFSGVNTFSGATVLGTPGSGTLTNCTGLPVSTGISGLGTGVATFLATPSSANLRGAITDETGTGSAVFATSPTLVTPVLGVATGTSLAVTGALTSSGTAGIGYATGAGGTVTQATSKGTAVTLNKTTGAITMNNAALAGATVATFVLNNSTIASTDAIHVNVVSGYATAATYITWAEGIQNGSCNICVENITAGSLSEALILRFVVIKGVSS